MKWGMTVAGPESPAKGGNSWLWVAVAAGAALSTAAVIWLLWYGDPAHRMDRILRRCQDRIGDIEEALSEMETSLRPA